MGALWLDWAGFLGWRAVQQSGVMSWSRVPFHGHLHWEGSCGKGWVSWLGLAGKGEHGWLGGVARKRAGRINRLSRPQCGSEAPGVRFLNTGMVPLGTSDFAKTLLHSSAQVRSACSVHAEEIWRTKSTGKERSRRGLMSATEVTGIALWGMEWQSGSSLKCCVCHDRLRSTAKRNGERWRAEKVEQNMADTTGGFSSPSLHWDITSYSHATEESASGKKIVVSASRPLPRRNSEGARPQQPLAPGRGFSSLSKILFHA